MGSSGSKTRSETSTRTCKPRRKGWTQNDWKVHGRYLAELSVPKKDFRQEILRQTPRVRKTPLKCLKPRVEALSQPKTNFGANNRVHSCHLPPHRCHCHVADGIWKVSAQARNYTPTKRIKALSQPKLDYQEVIRCFPSKKVMCLDKRVIQPQASYRTKNLALPKYQYLCLPKSDPYGVKREALMAVATRRTMQLAQPKTDFSYLS